MTLSLNVLNHLGISLYSNVPAVLSEAVANCWDADAATVWITIDAAARRIVIEDDGCGMSAAHVNERFLHVGYERRTTQGPLTPKRRRPMGRKGIGKLSLFSVANTVEVFTSDGTGRSALRMHLPEIRLKITERESTYFPTPIDFGAQSLRSAGSTGTRIALTDLRKQLSSETPLDLRRRLARRFSIIGPQAGFTVVLNGQEVTVEDRDYFHKIQYLWTYGDNAATYETLCTNAVNKERRPERTPAGRTISGWIGTAASAAQLKDTLASNESLNRIVVIVRGKLAQEDILDEFGEGGVYSKYLLGEIHADFMDVDEEDDIATSSRQRFIEDNPRYDDLRDFVRSELKHIQNRWTDLRNAAGEEKAKEQIPQIASWLAKLSPDEQRTARGLLGKINQLPIDDNGERRNLIKHAVIWFESARLRKRLRNLENVTVENIAALGPIMEAAADMEATLYHQIVKERLAVVKELQRRVDEGALEKLVQQHVFENLWLLDPSWERATEEEFMEARVKKAFGDVDSDLTAEEKTARLDIKYRRAVGRHVVIELKRADRVVETSELIRQVQKYRSAIRKVLEAQGAGRDSLEIVCIVGPQLRDWQSASDRDLSERSLANYDARVLRYDELLANAYRAYKEFIDRERDIGEVRALIEAIDNA
jgi:hypothetical protein